MRVAVLLIVGAFSASAQDGGTQLAMVRSHMTEVLAPQPNYTCLETVERAARGSREKVFRILDTVKLEVALVDGREMFAWPGSKQFEDTDMRHFVPSGMFGNGDFGLYAKAIFAGRSTRVVLAGQMKLEQKTVTRYDFIVPTEDGMRIQSGGSIALAGYRGSFYLEPGTLDVLRIEVVADSLPVSLSMRNVTDSMDYRRLQIGGSDFLLPSSAEAVMTDTRGDSSRNSIRFSSCREFAGESTLRFDDPPVDPSAAPTAKREVTLPKDLSFDLRLIDDIDTASAAVGDMVRAVLYADVKHKGQVLLAKGTPVSGRIIRLERNSNFTVIGLMFDQADSESAHADLSLTFDMAAGSGLLSPHARWGTTSPVRPHEGLVPLPPGHLRFGRGILLFWRT